MMKNKYGFVVELVYTVDLKSAALWIVGSSPTGATMDIGRIASG